MTIYKTLLILTLEFNRYFRSQFLHFPLIIILGPIKTFIPQSFKTFLILMLERDKQHKWNQCLCQLQYCEIADYVL